MGSYTGKKKDMQLLDRS